MGMGNQGMMGQQQNMMGGNPMGQFGQQQPMGGAMGNNSSAGFGFMGNRWWLLNLWLKIIDFKII